jgi:hypothetical protein
MEFKILKLEFKCYQNVSCNEKKIYAMELTKEILPVVLRCSRAMADFR